jgi:electron transport complex protein RnfG
VLNNFVLGKSITKNSMVLGVFAVVTAGILAFTFQLTASKIAAEERRAAQKALLEIVPLERHNNDMLNDTWPIPIALQKTLGKSDDNKIYIAKQNDAPVAVIIPVVAPDGYSGAIKLIVGINIDGTIAGVRVLAHKETPGLGDKIDLNKSPWILSFNGHSLEDPEPKKWAVKKDGGRFDQFTGATITPRAVVNRIKTTLEFFAEHRDEILAKSGATAGEAPLEQQL